MTYQGQKESKKHSIAKEIIKKGEVLANYSFDKNLTHKIYEGCQAVNSSKTTQYKRHV